MSPAINEQIAKLEALLAEQPVESGRPGQQQNVNEANGTGGCHGAVPGEQKDSGGEVSTPHQYRNGAGGNGYISPGTALGDGDSSNSFNSCPHAVDGLDCYPARLEEAAYHGLVGNAVSIIEPHTEADPAALLFQLLTAFGSIINRGSYMLADGAHHFGNLFGVLVGETAKGRKGTSWRQVAQLMARVDQQWSENCVTSGLSSGEGLIHNVRDPVTGTKTPKNFSPGEESVTVVKDPGVTDKRLLVTEGEFANVLKVMAREGNTLSPVVRQAWDGETLRTLTKNSPGRATDSHISILGHITRDEVRRLLNQTEAANGFANRFNWLAVRRSKFLPDGGNLDPAALNEVVRSLHEAIRFARTAGEVKRDGLTRELWWSVYPTLSDGKVGLFGAATARAEAQVTRFSLLYALLDQSPIIKPAHHHAAMALWKYCEQSARWIFGSSTGDKNADKILAALRNAGAAGLTRTQISESVFKRNLSSHDLQEALNRLRTAQLAVPRTEVTGGANSERWFLAGPTN